MARKRKFPKSGVECPICQVSRGETLEWIACAHEEFYDKRKASKYYNQELTTEAKQNFVQALQAVSTLGHVQKRYSRSHPKKAHQCTGLVEVGLFQSVELLNRGLLHVITGFPSPGMSLYRMALEVGVRYIFQEILYAFIVKKTKKRSVSMDFRSYVKECRDVVKRTKFKGFESCSLKIRYVGWPNVADTRDEIQIDPDRLSWASVLRNISGSSVLDIEGPIRKEIESLYGALSIYVHQRKSGLETIHLEMKEILSHIEDKDWAVRGVPRVEPNPDWIECATRIVDVLMALLFSLEHRVPVEIEEKKEDLVDWHRSLKRWCFLPLSTMELAVLLKQKQKR